MGAISLPYAQSLTIRGNSQQNIVDNHVRLSQRQKTTRVTQKGYEWQVWPMRHSTVFLG